MCHFNCHFLVGGGCPAAGAAAQVHCQNLAKIHTFPSSQILGEILPARKLSNFRILAKI